MEKEKSRHRGREQMKTEASPESKCPICLDSFDNFSLPDHCLHKFCFRCIYEWSKNKAECPMCKQPFSSIFHSIKSDTDYKEHVLKATEKGAPGGLRCRSRSTGERLHSRRRTLAPPDNGIMFEGSVRAAPRHPDQGISRMVDRLAARRRVQGKGQELGQPRDQEMIAFRRSLYRAGVRVRGVHGGGRQRDVSADFLRRNPACTQRLAPWLRRELTVLYGVHGSFVNIVQQIVMSLITQYDMDHQAFREELQPFLLACTDHFLHEFISFAKAPFNMKSYDHQAIYDCPAPALGEGDNSGNSILTRPEDFIPVEQNQKTSSSADSVGQSAWDDETPGPSYTTAGRTGSFSPSSTEFQKEVEEKGILQRRILTRGRDGSDTEEDCILIGYVKPMSERTPELIQLSSDSEVDHGNSAEGALKESHMRFPNERPTSSQQESEDLTMNIEHSQDGHGGPSHKDDRRHQPRGNFQNFSMSSKESKERRQPRSIVTVVSERTKASSGSKYSSQKEKHRYSHYTSERSSSRWHWESSSSGRHFHYSSHFSSEGDETHFSCRSHSCSFTRHMHNPEGRRSPARSKSRRFNMSEGRWSDWRNCKRKTKRRHHTHKNEAGQEH